MTSAPARRSLRLRLTGIAAAGAALVLAAGAIAMYVVLTSRLDAALSTELGVRASDVEAELSSGTVVSLGGPLRTQVLDDSGAVLAPAGESPLVDPVRAVAVEAREEFDEDDQRVLVRRVPTGDGDRLVVVVGSTSSISQARNQLALVLAVAGPVVLVGVTGSVWVLTGAALAPVRSMTRRARTISVAEPGERLPEPGGDDEIAELASTLNRMLDRITESVQHERSFIDNASHELRTPMAVLRGELELLGTEVRALGDTPAAVTDGIASALEETDRLTRLAEQLLVLARIDAGDSRTSAPCRLGEVAATVAARLGPAATDRGVVVTVAVDGPDEVAVDPDAAGRIVTNLVGNAVRYATGVVAVTVAEGPDGVRLVVADDGPGFAATVLDRPFERFLRADPNRQGTGLGLAIVAGLADAAGGSASLGNESSLGGAWVRVDLPRPAG